MLEDPLKWPSFDGSRVRYPPKKSMVLRELVESCHSLNDAGRLDELALLVASGVGPGYLTQLDYAPDIMDEDQLGSVHRFYGNVYGISKNIMVRDSALSVVRSHLLEDSLATDRGHTFTWVPTFEGEDEREEAPVQSIPYIPFATFHKTGSLGILLPGLYSPRRSSAVTLMEFRTVWDTIIAPALMHAISPSSPEEPTYTHDPTIHSLPEHCIPAFVEKVKERALHSGIRWLTDIYFVHVIQSQSDLHPLNQRIEASVTLETYLSENGIQYSDIDADEILNGNWYIDVAVDVSVPGRCVVWRTECHSDIHKAITDEDLDQSDSGYKCYPFSHIVGASGCRMVPRFSPQDTCAPDYAYIDLKMADETLRAVDEDGLILDSITPAHLANRPQNHLPFLHNLAKLYGGRQTLISAQIVIRASLGDADSAFLGFDCKVLDKACLSFGHDDFWYWRALRAFGLSRIMERLRISAPHLYRHPGSLALSDAIAFLVNSFHTTYHDDNPNNLPYPISTDRGIVFLENISLGGRGEAPHFTEGFSKTHYALESKRLPQEDLPLYIALTSQHGPVPSPPPPHPAPCAALPFRSATPFLGSKVPCALYDGDTTSIRKLEFARERDILVDESMHGFVRQLQNNFFTDILSKAPRTPSRVSCLRSTPRNQQFSDLALFHQANLATAFTAVRWKHATRDEWIRVFDLFFPAHAHSSTSSVVADQYHSMPYFKHWQRLKKILSGVSFDILRSAVWTTFFKSLYWIPFASPHRVWGTGSVGSFTPFPGASPGAPYASVLINGETDPSFDPHVLS